MMESAMDVTGNEVTVYQRQIEVRLARPAPRVRYEKGKAIKEPTPDMSRVIAAVEDDLTAAIQGVYGEQTEVRLTLAQAPDIRLTGSFQEKPAAIREVVGEMLASALEGLDLSE